MKNSVTVLLTWDIDPFLDVCTDDKNEALSQTRELLSDYQIQSTFFLPAKMAEALGSEVRGLIRDGHEIGCHGLTHGDEENYNQMPQDMLQAYVAEATEIVQKMTGEAVSSFRGPRMKTSHITQGILAELGYTADCSVASQRIDFVSSNLINLGWIIAPRLPYRPSHRSAFRKGERHIWVVPLSAVIVPFISSVLYLLRVRFMKMLFRVLYAEAERTDKPIVYLAHPFEFAPSKLRHKPENMSFIQEVRTHGFLIRERFLEEDHYKRFKMNEELLAYMKSFPQVQFKTVREYVSDKLMSCEKASLREKS